MTRGDETGPTTGALDVAQHRHAAPLSTITTNRKRSALAMKAPNSRRRFLLALGVATGALSSGATGLRAEDAAVARIRRFSDVLIATMKQAQQLSAPGRYQRLRPVIAQTFDVGTMIRIAVGPAWNSISGGQRAALQREFSDFIAATYANRFDGYNGERFEIDPDAGSQGGAQLVRTRIIEAGGSRTDINYVVRGGRVVDVYLQGNISELAARRAEFSSLIASGGADALISSLQQRTRRLAGTA